MAPAVSRLPLVLLLLAAACILAGGVALSRREQVVRLPQEREPLRLFASALQKELLKLEALHQKHLRDLSQRVSTGDAVRTQQECETIVGVVACTFLPRGRARAEEHLRLPGISPTAYPQPTFESPSLARADLRVLEPAHFLESIAPPQGWLEDPGWPLTYWSQTPKGILVFLTIEPRQVQAATTAWMQSWLSNQPAFARLLDDHARITLPDGSLLNDATAASTSEDREAPHWSQVLATRYGNWHLISWDRQETRVSHHDPTLAIAATLSVMIALLGILVFHQQRRAHRLAAQRVSFVNRVSHELRTPLTNMLLNLDLIEESLPDSSSRAGSRLALVREEAARLARLIENVLTFSRAEQGRLKLHAVPCHPREVVAAVVTQFSEGFTRRDIRVTCSHSGNDIPCELDADALSQITANLLSNVEKYAPGAPVHITTNQSPTRLEMTVRDEGQGIPPSEADRIFSPFIRLDDRVRAGVTGTGLGLSIARELAERMGGTLRLQPSEKGAAFVLNVPLASSTTPLERTTSSSTPPHFKEEAALS